MSSHREAPEISKDPVADNTDIYAFVSPDEPDTVTHHHATTSRSRTRPAVRTSSSSETTSSTRSTSTTTATARPDIVYEFRFDTKLRNPEHVPVQHRTDRVAQRPELEPAPVLHRDAGRGQARPAREVLGKRLPSPPCNIGPRSTPNYPALAEAAVHTSADGETVFAGQRNDAFFVDLGAIFDLGDLRPFQNLHLIPIAGGGERRHARAAQRAHDRDPDADRAADARTAPCRPTRRAPKAVLGIWGARAARRR